MSHIVYLDDFFVVRKRRKKFIKYIKNLFPKYGHLSSKETYAKRRLIALLGVIGVYACYSF